MDKSLIPLLAAISTHKSNRIPQNIPVRFTELEEAADSFPEGTITLIITRTSSEEDFAALGNSEISTQLIESASHRILEGNKVGRTYSIEDGAKILTDQLSQVDLFDLRYNGRPIVEGVPIRKDAPMAAITLPYAGGGLDPKLIQAIAYPADPISPLPVGIDPRIATPIGPDDPLPEGVDPRIASVIAVAVTPKLTDIERRVLDQVPTNVGNTRIGDIGPLAVTVTTVTVVLFVAAFHCPAYGGAQRINLIREPLAANDLERLSALERDGQILPAAKELLAMRSRATMEFKL